MWGQGGIAPIFVFNAKIHLFSKNLAFLVLYGKLLVLDPKNFWPNLKNRVKIMDVDLLENVPPPKRIHEGGTISKTSQSILVFKNMESLLTPSYPSLAKCIFRIEDGWNKASKFYFLLTGKLKNECCSIFQDVCYEFEVILPDNLNKNYLWEYSTIFSSSATFESWNFKKNWVEQTSANSKNTFRQERLCGGKEG